VRSLNRQVAKKVRVYRKRNRRRPLKRKNREGKKKGRMDGNGGGLKNVGGPLVPERWQVKHLGVKRRGTGKTTVLTKEVDKVVKEEIHIQRCAIENWAGKTQNGGEETIQTKS